MRSKKEDEEYIKNLKREHDVQRKLIIYLRAEHKKVLSDSARYMQTVINLTSMLVHFLEPLNVYRQSVLDSITKKLDTDEVPGFRWDRENGWFEK